MAIGRTKDGDELCLGHIRANGIKPEDWTAIQQPESAAPYVAARSERLADLESAGKEKAMPSGIPKTPGVLCSVCKKSRLRKDSVGGMCGKCRKAAAKLEKEPKAPVTATLRGKPMCERRAKKRPVFEPGPPPTAIPVVAISVTEDWLDGFWKLLSFEQKASVVSGQFAGASA